MANTTHPVDSNISCKTFSIVRTYHGIVSAELVFDTPFNGSCAGTFECTVILKVENSSLLTEGERMYSQDTIPFQLSLTSCVLHGQKMQLRTHFELFHVH